MVLDIALLNTQHYKVEIKGKVEQSREWMVWFFCLMAYQLFRLFHAKAILQEEQ